MKRWLTRLPLLPNDGRHARATFWHLDGCNMEDEFAFDISHRTREERDEERRKWDEFSCRMDAERSERERLGMTDSRAEAGGPWSRSFNVTYTAEVPFGIRVFGVGTHLAELIVDLRAGNDCKSTPQEAQHSIDQLNRDFGNLREILRSSDSSLTEALLDPVRDRFIESLAVVATARPDLAPQCDSLTSELRKLLDLPPQSGMGRRLRYSVLKLHHG